MGKLKGQGTLTRLITSKLAALNRNSFSLLAHDVAKLKQLANRTDTNRTIQLKLVSFSSSRDYPEQIISILSFLRYVGTPLSWIIYSDGSHSTKEVEIIQTALPFVQVIHQGISNRQYQTNTLKLSLRPYQCELDHFAQKHFLGRRLSLYLNHTIDSPTLFLDSDVLFYKKASVLRTMFVNPKQGWFLSEKWGTLDQRYIINNATQNYQVNAGFFLMNTELTNLHEGLYFLNTARRHYEYFTEQTVIHILLNANKYLPLDSTLFVIDTNDQFDFSYAYTPDKIAVRHYTGPVRHKMWQSGWKWQLSVA